jgi:hypothetical protein
MNAGIADAMNLSWMLAACLKGWAPESILEAHELERQPITEQVSRFAMKHAEGAIRERSGVPHELEHDTPEGQAARRQVGDDAYRLHVQQFACAGLNYGYYYDRSPIIAYDAERAPPYSMYDYTPSTVPGCRLPHFWLRDGRGLYDALAQDHTLLRFDPSLDASGLLDAAAHAGVPLTILDIEAKEVPDAYRHRLILCRPDQHVAWRGDDSPKNARALIDLIRGIAS